ncbi:MULTISPECIES: antibiotic biosynthesis monooxygenase [Acidiplasma]|jgi:heme-degrading monooxygenase HmoA|uniref:Antibiotic biosynthesis monooxygenase n=3 Tax=Acidiplasma TaxID=507753 RepID=A0A0Q0XJL9_9ARCH|nr:MULTISPECIES: antibiotic biosynthesis monooxygenase [Acidiplasma]KJE48830.1 antibiotic biosynthesis monooxygenase [Acidiplasma sp. MBA-1]KQB34415.1 antibiotic biosynthesis monooxygenase [Acidiplasma aeolicum]KQB35135.1 antibiotic biosynthesis monooxygenase [Acidiplasma cupricumulans]WMT54225.1 MAG: antibiotic biosynthesis monooxygenase [Acidiplasma sp.]
MINVGLYYKVKQGHEKDFENAFGNVVKLLKSSDVGFLDGKLYKEVDCPREYMIYTEWKDIDSFKNFLKMKEYNQTVDYGKTILESMPRHKIFGESKE